MDSPFIVPVALFAFLSVASLAMSPIFRAIGRRMENRQLPADPNRSELVERMERMEQAVDAIAVQVERIAEGQRFTTKLLSDRVADSRALTSSETGSEV
ncbi:MAG TPA: hypothetical protein VGQ52_04315 [Gemmatimonadaceae bacterium]|jgi:hypothetical protein|nr:hypothetical protein [Gemmatimonadaceae bacterium]